MQVPNVLVWILHLQEPFGRMWLSIILEEPRNSMEQRCEALDLNLTPTEQVVECRISAIRVTAYACTRTRRESKIGAN